MEMPLPGMNISVNTGADKILRVLKTDSEGKATIKLNARDLVADKEGVWPFSASFTGNDSIDAASAEITIRNASLSMTLDEADSIKKINLHAEKYGSGKMMPAAGEVMTVYVKRMFSLLPLGEVTFDDAGNGSVDFPADLPGDKEGNVTIIAKFEDHPEFGNVERIAVAKWGMPPVVSAHQSRRALWTKTAPRWMIYTLTILLTGVWAHYMFALISLVRIKRDANRTRKVVVNEEIKDLFIK
ncbi:MAG TPA: hypothetical protein VHO68_13810, partial [Bacteroidales bacterium]|nr:hypothetical protein [Bacteroidales bacterium]